MGRKIVFINQATGYLTIDIINVFSEKFDKVSLITGSIRIQDRPLNQKIEVSSIVRYNRGSNFRKAISWMLGTIQIFFLLKFKYSDFEKIFFTIPPTAYLTVRRPKPSYSIIIYDLYPDALEINGFSEKNILYRWWSGRNRKIFHRAYRIYTLSDNMRSMVIKYSERPDIKVVSNWSAFSGFNPVPKSENRIIMREGLSGKFIVQYSGNIGVTHNVEALVEVAGKLGDAHSVLFQIIGRGERSNTIRDMIDERGLTNCILLPFREDYELYESLCAADISVVTLDDKTNDISVPSKLYNLMAAGLPVMAIAPLNSAIAGIISGYSIGKTFEKNDITGMCEFILHLKNNPEIKIEIAANAHRASLDFTSSNALKYLEYYME